MNELYDIFEYLYTFVAEIILFIKTSLCIIKSQKFLKFQQI